MGMCLRRIEFFLSEGLLYGKKQEKHGWIEHGNDKHNENDNKRIFILNM